MKRIFTFVLAVMLVLPFILVPALAAPVGAGVTESSGDGFALYNGLKLPNFDLVDSTNIPSDYFFIQVNDAEYTLICMDHGEFYYNPDTSTLYKSPVSAPNFQATYFKLVDSQWVEQRTVSSANFYVASLVYANFTVYSDAALNNIYLPFTDPIPLDGMTVIEWDGSVINHNSLADHLWRVSDLTPSIHQLTGGYSVFKSVATGNLTVATLNVGSTLTQEDGYIYFTGGGVYPNAKSPGIYFHYNQADLIADQVQTQLLAFSATEGGGGGVQPDPSFPTDPTLPDVPTDPTLSVDEKFDQIQKDQVVIKDSLDKIHSDQINTNNKLDQVHKNQVITNNKLDDIISGIVKPDTPSGGNIITDNDDLESQIKDHITPGIDSIGDWFTDSLETFEEYSGVFLIIIWLFDKIVDIGFFKPLLAISVSLGVVCSILGIGMTLANKPKRGD